MWDWVWMDNILAGYKKFEFSDTSLRSIISVIIFVWMPEETCYSKYFLDSSQIYEETLAKSAEEFGPLSNQVRNLVYLVIGSGFQFVFSISVVNSSNGIWPKKQIERQ